MNTETISIMLLFGGLCFMWGINKKDSAYREGYRAAIRDCNSLFEGLHKATELWLKIMEELKASLEKEK